MSQVPPPEKDPTALEKKEEAVVDLLEQVPQNLIRETLIGIIREGTAGGPRIDPETFKLAAQTAQQEQEHKLTFLMRKLEVEDTQNNRQHELDVSKHNLEVERTRSLLRMCWPILAVIIFVVVTGIVSGIYFAATPGKETLGFSILSATVTGLFAYIGGLGTPRFWEKK